MPDSPGTHVGFVKKWAPLFVMGLAIIIIVLDTTLLNVSIGTILKDLNTDIVSLQWVITSYSLTLAALTITGGRLGDLFGRKKMFITGAVIFAAGSFIASISHSVGMLILGEAIIEGFGAAMMVPATASLLVSAYRGRDRALALGIWGAMAATGAAIGPIIGGWLTSSYSWRWGFRINVFVAAALMLGSVIVAESRTIRKHPDIDWPGIFLSSTGLLSGVFAIIESTQYGWWAAKKTFSIAGFSLGPVSIVPLSLAFCAVLLSCFVAWERYTERRGRVPLVSMSLFFNRQFTSGATTTMVLAMGQSGMIFGLPVFLQGVKGLDAFHTGLYMVPLPLALLIAAPLGGFISNTFVPKRIVQAGLVLNIIGLLLLRFTLQPFATQADLFIPLSMYGFGVGLGMSQLGNLTLSAVAVEDAGEASGVNSTMRQIGLSLGSAVIGAVLVVTLSSSLKNGIANSPQIQADKRSILSAEIAQQASRVEFGAAVSSSLPLSTDEQQVIKDLANMSTIKANKTAILMTAASSMLAFLVAMRLPYTRQVERRPAGGH